MSVLTSSTDGIKLDLSCGIPDEIIREILLHLDPKFIVLTATLVCKQWNNVIKEQSLWREKSLRDGLGDPLTLKGVSDFQKYYFYWSRNLIQNGWNEDKGKKWTSLSSQFITEECYPTAVGSKPLPLEARLESGLDVGVFHCAATSYSRSTRSQVVDLHRFGITADLMNGDDRPDILVSEWTAARFDCASVYDMNIELCDDHNVKLAEFTESVEQPQWTEGHWQKVSHVFSPVPRGVRYIVYEHSGSDRQFWAGHYGSKFTGATVKLQFKKKTYT